MLIQEWNSATSALSSILTPVSIVSKTRRPWKISRVDSFDTDSLVILGSPVEIQHCSLLLLRWITMWSEEGQASALSYSIPFSLFALENKCSSELHPSEVTYPQEGSDIENKRSNLKKKSDWGITRYGPYKFKQKFFCLNNKNLTVRGLNLICPMQVKRA